MESKVVVEHGRPLDFKGVSKECDSEESKEAHQIAQTLKAFRRSAFDLLRGRFSCYANHVPPHLVELCDIFVIRCADGVLVRYDSAANPEMRARSSVVQMSLKEAAPMFSENFLFVEKSPSDRQLLNGGPVIVFSSLNENGRWEEQSRLSPYIVVSKAALDRDNALQSKTRPPYAVSFSSQFDIRLIGEVTLAERDELENEGETQKFIANSSMTLKVGWKAVELYPLIDSDHWNPALASSWAEVEIMTYAAQRNLLKNELIAIDPCAATQEECASLLDKFQSLLGDKSEEVIHQFLLRHPELICPKYDKCWSKVKFGAAVSDFVFREPHNDFTLVEIEHPNKRLFRNDGQQTESLTHAINQISDWVRYIEDNKATVETELGLKGISTNPRRIVIIGRSDELSSTNRRKLTTMQNEQPTLRVLTYDDLLDSAKRTFEHILGPLSLITQNVEIYYPSKKTENTLRSE